MLSTQEQRLHHRAKKTFKLHRHMEWKVIETLQAMDHCQLFKKYEYSSLYKYAVTEMDLTPPTALNFIGVSRKANQVPQLQEALRKQKLSVALAGRLVSAITKENATALIEFARTHTYKETNFECARINPKARKGFRSTAINEQEMEVRVVVPKSALEDLNRLQSVAAQRNQSTDEGEIIARALKELRHREDPVKKAERVKPSKESFCAQGTRRRVTLKAKEKHRVHQRDQGCCTYVMKDGSRCGNDRFVHIHHLKAVKDGGSNHPDNLATLCAFHHDLIHQMEFELA